jgi:hypothetical protein
LSFELRITSQKAFEPSAERIAIILLLPVFAPQGEKPVTENGKYHAAAGEKTPC